MKTALLKAFFPFAIGGIWGNTAQAQVYTDPATAAAVELNTAVIGKKLDDSKKAQATVAAENLLIYAQLDSIRKYDRIMVGYLKKAHGVFNNIYQITECINLSEQIISGLNKCRQAAVEHPEGGVITALVSKHFSQIVTESTGLVGNISTLVTGGGESNMLTSAERLQLLYAINSRLHALNRLVNRLRWQIQNFVWMDLLRETDPDLYWNLMNDERAYTNSCRRIERMIAH